MRAPSSLAHLAAPSKRLRLWINLIGLGLASLLLATIALNLGPPTDDSRQYRQGARNVLTYGDPYATTFINDWSTPPYPNPPLLAYLLVPTVPLGEAGGRTLWFGLNLMALVALVVISLRIVELPRLKAYWGLLSLVVVLAPPVYLCLLYGQLGIMLTLLLVAGFACAERRPALAGALLAFAAAIKIYPALVGGFYLLRGPRRVVWWAAGFGLLLLAFPILFHGLQPYQSYGERVLFSGFYPYAAEFNVSLMGLARRLFTVSGTRFSPVAELPLLASLLTLLGSLAVVALCVRSSFTPGRLGAQLSFSMWLCATLLLSPINGYYNLAGLIFPLFVLIRALYDNPERHLIGITALATALLALPPGWYRFSDSFDAAIRQGWTMMVLVPPLFGLILYLVVLDRLAARLRRAQE
ncbi:MAG: glycosyltransferase family 87 protein [Oscillochloridaceae bacterium umkhey_bin13]